VTLQALGLGGPHELALPEAAARSRWADCRSGRQTNVRNPKVALFFLACLPPFIAPATPNKSLAFLGLGAVFVLQGLVFLLGVVPLAARLRRLGAHPSAGRWPNAAGAGLFSFLADRLVAVKP
jgi:threonine/homoserine/homoserine lactone efflux protein